MIGPPRLKTEEITIRLPILSPERGLKSQLKRLRNKHNKGIIQKWLSSYLSKLESFSGPIYSPTCFQALAMFLFFRYMHEKLQNKMANSLHCNQFKMPASYNTQ